MSNNEAEGSDAMTTEPNEPTTDSPSRLRTDESVAIAGGTTAADPGGPPMRTDQTDHPDETAALACITRWLDENESAFDGRLFVVVAAKSGFRFGAVPLPTESA